MPANIDALVPEKHLIDLEGHSQGDFESAIDGFVIEKVFDDTLLAEYIDMVDGDNIIRNGIAIPINTITSAWRKAKVHIVGPNVKQVVVGDIIVFPNDKGMRISKLPIYNGEEYIIKNGVFLNEDRIFGICKHESR